MKDIFTKANINDINFNIAKSFTKHKHRGKYVHSNVLLLIIKSFKKKLYDNVYLFFFLFDNIKIKILEKFIFDLNINI